LDLGCGVGTLGTLLERAGGDWTFLEPDAAAVSEARAILHGPVHCSTLEEARFPPASFALVTAFDVIEHVTDPQALLRQIARVLQPGGFFIATTPAAEEGTYVWRSVGKQVFGITKETHGHVLEGFSRAQLAALLHTGGLEPRTLEVFSKFFTEAVELLYNGAYYMKNARRQKTTGYNLALSPASQEDVRRHPRTLLLLKVVAPPLRGISLLDRVVPFGPGYEYGIVAIKTGAQQ
jgi:2-polyprenyl-3-methyl-5-hydroxy-6-metoxy-1,4-benzoquinol methylase